MPELTIKVGGKSYLVACQAGEEHFLETAAAMLDKEASDLMAQIGALPENRMLLMAGLMLADKTAADLDQKDGSAEKVQSLSKSLDALKLETDQAKQQHAAEITSLRAELESAQRDLEQAQANQGPSSEDVSRLEAIALQAEALASNLEEKNG